METLLNTNIVQLDATSGENDGDIYLPTVDGNFLPPSSELVRTGCFTKMPILAGWTNNDATLFTPTTIETENDTKLPRKIYPAITPITLQSFLALYPVSTLQPNPPPTCQHNSTAPLRYTEIFYSHVRISASGRQWRIMHLHLLVL
jgi:hypothetical protein